MARVLNIKKFRVSEQMFLPLEDSDNAVAIPKDDFVYQIGGGDFAGIYAKLGQENNGEYIKTSITREFVLVNPVLFQEQK